MAFAGIPARRRARRHHRVRQHPFRQPRAAAEALTPAGRSDATRGQAQAWQQAPAEFWPDTGIFRGAPRTEDAGNRHRERAERCRAKSGTIREDADKTEDDDERHRRPVGCVRPAQRLHRAVGTHKSVNVRSARRAELRTGIPLGHFAPEDGVRHSAVRPSPLLPRSEAAEDPCWAGKRLCYGVSGTPRMQRTPVWAKSIEAPPPSSAAKLRSIRRVPKPRRVGGTTLGPPLSTQRN